MQLLFVYLQDSERQKLIYSGKLLNDDQTLKDVLRQPVCLCVCVFEGGGSSTWACVISMIILGKENEHGCMAGLYGILC